MVLLQLEIGCIQASSLQTLEQNVQNSINMHTHTLIPSPLCGKLPMSTSMRVTTTTELPQTPTSIHLHSQPQHSYARNANVYIHIYILGTHQNTVKVLLN